MAEPAPRRRTFGPVVLLGLAASALASVAGTKPWVSGRSGTVDTDQASAVSAVGGLDGVRDSPLAGALALAVLASWGVLLVTRGRFRRAVAALALVGSVALAIVTVEAFWSLQDKLSDALFDASGTDTASVTLTGWYAAALVAALGCVVATLAAVRLTPGWPEMGTRYDAPTAGDDPGARDVPTENIDIWKALDEGRDPTA